MKNLIRILAAFGLLMMVCSVALSQSKTPITKEDLVGEYSYSHRWGGGTLELKGDGTFKDVGGSCTNEFFDGGTYLFDGKFLILTYDPKAHKITTHDGKDVTEDFEKQNSKEKSSEPTVSKYISVRWGDRMYLLWEKELINFCNAVNLGFEPSNDELNQIAAFTGNDFDIGFFYLRNNDENRITTGLPELPDEYQSYLLSKPLIGKILKIEKEGNKTFAQINLGRRNGIKEKMILLAEKKTRQMFSTLAVESVQENTSRVEVYSEVKVGDKVSTRYQGPKTLNDFYQSVYSK